jgi:hypothetical protein
MVVYKLYKLLPSGSWKLVGSFSNYYKADDEKAAYMDQGFTMEIRCDLKPYNDL